MTTDEGLPMPMLLRTLTLPRNANLNGGVFGGWIMGELDKAAGLLGMRRGGGSCATVAVENLLFLAPLGVGEEFTIYGVVESVGRSSMRLRLDGHAATPGGGASRRVVEGLFVSVALDAENRPRLVPREEDGPDIAGSESLS